MPGSECDNILYGELLVGAGIWGGSQLEISPIGSSEAAQINPCNFLMVMHYLDM